MLGVGPGEMVLIAVIALVVIGPEKFPEFAKIAIRTFRDLRGYMDDVKGELRKELQPVKKEIDQVSKYKPEDYIDAMTGETAKDDKPLDYDKKNDPYGYAAQEGTDAQEGSAAQQDASVQENASAQGTVSESSSSTKDEWDDFAVKNTSADSQPAAPGQDAFSESGAPLQPPSNQPPERLDG